MPRAGKGIVFFVIKGVIFAQSQAWLGAKQRNTVNLAAWHWDVLLIAPPQPAKKVELPLFWMIVIGCIRPRERVIS